MPADPSAIVAKPEDRLPDPLEPLLGLHADIRRALDHLANATDSTRSAAIEELRARLAIHDDVARRIVHPMAARVGDAPADAAAWRAERDETAAGRMLAAIARIEDEGGEPAAWTPGLVAEVRQAIDRDEAQMIELLRAHMDDNDLRELGDAIHEACATSQAPGARR